MSLTKITSDGITDGSIVNADLHSAANIAKSKLASLDIVNADINASAAIAGTKISPSFTSDINITNSAYDAMLDIFEYDDKLKTRYNYDQVCSRPPPII